MAADPIRELKVTGTHRQVGQQIGEAVRPLVQRMAAQVQEHLPAGVTWESMREKARICLAFSRGAYAQYVEELEGLADGAGVPFETLFVAMCEELWEPDLWRGARKGCTDLAARGRATDGGATLLAHTNDLDPGAEKDLVILRVQAADEPEFLGVSVGGAGISAGFNAAGIGLTGNELSSNDVRLGVPRLMVVRAILGARRLGEAMDACLLPERASSYNNVIADANGEVYSMEGSATDCEPIYIVDDILAHANHYVSPTMRRYEVDRNQIGGSVIRHNRGMRLLRENFGDLSPELFQKLLADHANHPAGICKHGIESVTAFSIIIDLNQLRAWIGRGRPCETTFHQYVLDPWRPDL
jgi:isopenicillin-N N-acyltransferase-like protein